MQRFALSACLLLCLSSGAVAANGGLKLKPDAVIWPEWQARISVVSVPVVLDVSLTTATGGAVLGDRYLTGPLFGEAGGVRLSGGLLFGPRADLLMTPLTLGAARYSLASASAHSAAPQSIGAVSATGSARALMLGVGLTAQSFIKQWGFSADVGLMAIQPGASSWRMDLSRAVDDPSRGTRVVPVIQLGVSYSF